MILINVMLFISFEFLAGCLRHYCRGVGIDTVKSLYGFGNAI